jgi:antitoxin component of RelBE/YafQ-DinJ toxin-antitoxin module
MPETPRRFIRIDDDLWSRAMQRADAEGTDVSKVIRSHLERYVITDEETSIAEVLERIVDDINAVRKRVGQH